MSEPTICILPGCGRPLSEKQLKYRKRYLKAGIHVNGPFCSQQCSADYRKIMARKERKRIQEQDRERVRAKFHKLVGSR